MPLGEPLLTVKVKTPEKEERDWRRINQRDFDPDRHEPFDEEEAEKVEAEVEGEESPGGELTYELHANGAWSLFEGGQEVESGRGKSDLADAISERIDGEVTEQELSPNA